MPFFRVSAGSSPSLSSSPRALSRVAPRLLCTTQRILSLTFCIFSSSRFTEFFSTDFSVPQGLQPSSPTCADGSPGCVCMCVTVCLCVALPSLLATWTQCQAACIREAHTQVHPHVPNAHSGLAASKTIVHRCPSLGAPYLTSGWSPGQVHPDHESAPGHTTNQKDTLVILARPAESVETPGPSWSHLQLAGLSAQASRSGGVGLGETDELWAVRMQPTWGDGSTEACTYSLGPQPATMG